MLDNWKNFGYTVSRAMIIGFVSQHSIAGKLHLDKVLVASLKLSIYRLFTPNQQYSFARSDFTDNVLYCIDYADTYCTVHNIVLYLLYCIYCTLLDVLGIDCPRVWIALNCDISLLF